MLDVRSFRFNPAYRVDLVLWREIPGGATGAWYVKPSASCEIFEGLSAQLAIVHSQAMHAESTPSTVDKPLGIEVDAGLRYRPDDGFHMWFDAGMFRPLDGFDCPPGLTSLPAPYFSLSLARGWTLRTGLAVEL